MPQRGTYYYPVEWPTAVVESAPAEVQKAYEEAALAGRRAIAARGEAKAASLALGGVHEADVAAAERALASKKAPPRSTRVALEAKLADARTAEVALERLALTAEAALHDSIRDHAADWAGTVLLSAETAHTLAHNLIDRAEQAVADAGDLVQLVGWLAAGTYDRAHAPSGLDVGAEFRAARAVLDSEKPADRLRSVMARHPIRTAPGPKQTPDGVLIDAASASAGVYR